LQSSQDKRSWRRRVSKFYKRGSSATTSSDDADGNVSDRVLPEAYLQTRALSDRDDPDDVASSEGDEKFEASSEVYVVGVARDPGTDDSDHHE
jgi:hypothetical protein